MNARRTRSLLLALALLVPAGLRADDGEQVSSLFPLEVGRSWTYRLNLQVGDQTRAMEYVTRVVREEVVEGVGPCAALESRSNQKVFQTDWFRLDGNVLSNPKRQEGAGGPVTAFPSRTLLTGEALRALRRTGDGATWEWASEDGAAKGTVTLEREERVHHPPFGSQECVVLLDRGTFQVGKSVRHQERRMWLAPGLGVLREVMTVKKASGEVTIRTEAQLKRYDAP